MSQIFISYARKDGTKFKDLLRGQLQENGFTHWIDTEQILAGDNWPKRIDDALRDSFALILVLTTGAIESVHVTYEWMFALGCGIRIIPLKCHDLEKEMHPRLKDYSYEEFGDPTPNDWNRLMDLLTNLLRNYQADEFVSELPPNTPRYVVNCLNDLELTDERKQRKAVEDLSNSDLEAATRQLARISHHHHLAELRIYAAFKFLDNKLEHLSKYKREIILGLSDGLRAANDDVRRRASHELQQIGDDSIPVLIDALNYSYSETRYAAVKILGNLKVNSVHSHIQLLLHDAHEKVVCGAVDALISIGDIKSIELLNSLATDSRMSDRNLLSIGGFLSRKGSDLGKKVLLKLVAQSDYNNFAQDAADMLIELGRDLLVMHECEKIVADDKYFTNRILAAEILVSAVHIPALHTLLKAIDDKNPFISYHIIEMIGRMRTPEALDKFIGKLDDPDSRVRSSAKWAIQQLGTEEAIKALKDWEAVHSH